MPISLNASLLVSSLNAYIDLVIHCMIFWFIGCGNIF